VDNATALTLYPGKETRYELHSKLGGAPGQAWMCMEILAPTGILTPDYPFRSEQQNRLLYPGLVKII